MSTQLIPFSFEAHEIRVLIVDNAPWWVLAEVLAKDRNNPISTRTWDYLAIGRSHLQHDLSRQLH